MRDRIVASLTLSVAWAILSRVASLRFTNAGQTEVDCLLLNIQSLGYKVRAFI
jgi:hypothetical protein